MMMVTKKKKDGGESVEEGKDGEVSDSGDVVEAVKMVLLLVGVGDHGEDTR